jgi:O-acetyl-ADP-ribose deacetylase (regulator of RNase III)
MITYHTGSIFDSGCEALVNPVNCKGVSGAGLAKAFADKFPHNQVKYANLCRQGFVEPGDVVLTTPEHTPTRQWIINLATKNHWKDPSQLRWIGQGMVFVEASIKKYGIKSVAFPMLGCGLGGLKWDDVRPVMLLILAKYPDDYDFRIYGPAPQIN